MTKRETISNLLRNFLESGDKRDFEQFFILIAKMLNSNNAAASKIKSMLNELHGNIEFKEMVMESIGYIYLKKDYLLSILNEKREIKLNYLYTLIKNTLITELNKKEVPLTTKKQDGEDEDFNILDIIEDERVQEGFKKIEESGIVENYFQLLIENLKEEDLEVLCYYFAKDKGLNLSPFLSYIEKTNTKDKKVSRLRKDLSVFIKTLYSNETDFKKEHSIWISVFEKIWSEICEKKVNNSESTSSEECRD